MLTFLWFEPTKCFTLQLVEVNNFNKLSKKWQHDRYKIDKFSNFNGCRINFLFQAGLPEFDAVEIDYKKKEITKCSGYVCAILKDLKNHLNYTYHMDVLTVFQEKSTSQRTLI